MNALEKKMLDIACKLRDEFGLVSVKAEFEAEGNTHRRAFEAS